MTFTTSLLCAWVLSLAVSFKDVFVLSLSVLLQGAWVLSLGVFFCCGSLRFSSFSRVQVPPLKKVEDRAALTQKGVGTKVMWLSLLLWRGAAAPSFFDVELLPPLGWCCLLGPPSLLFLKCFLVCSLLLVGYLPSLFLDTSLFSFVFVYSLFFF